MLLWSLAQDYANELYNTFCKHLTAARAAAAEKKIDVDVTGEARTAAIQSIVTKQMTDTRSHIRVVNNSSYHFLQWDPAHIKLADEETAYATTSVCSRASSHAWRTGC